MIENLFIAFALAMDCFAVSVVCAVILRRRATGIMLRLAFLFGFFQALMPFIGWLLGASFTGVIEKYDHWIAFFILVILGIKTVWETAREKDDEAAGRDEPLKLRTLLLLGIATSIDALAAGVTRTVSEIPLWVSLLVIGGVTFVLSFLGVFLGNRFGSVFRKPACYLGGIILILIGVKMLLEGLGILAF